jgi:hypothetical protein
MHEALALHCRSRRVPLHASRGIPVAIALLLALPGMARAEAPAPLPAAEPHPAPIQSEKSPGMALGLSLVGTGVGVGLLAAADDDQEGLSNVGALLVFVGPNLGHFYAGETSRGLGHIGLRAAAGGAMVVGAVWTFFEACTWGFFGEESHCDSPPPGAAALLIGGAVVSSASAIYSIYDAPRAAQRANARAKARQLMLTPAPVSGPDGTNSLGLHMTGRF